MPRANAEARIDSDAPAGFRHTLRALIEPKRSAPVLLIGAALMAAQVHLSRSPRAWAVALAMALVTWLVAPYGWRLLLADSGSAASTAVRAGLFSLMGLAVVTLTGPWLSRGLSIGQNFLTEPSSLAVCVALFVVGGWGLGRDIELERRLAKERARADAMARVAEQAQLLALRAHLDPHFLFNTLNAIAEWCRQDGETAERAVLQLSRMLRGVLDGVKAPSWPLERELELVRTLFELHQLRDPNLFTLRWNVAPGLPEVALPPLLLLPLAENAVKHGPSAGHRGELSLDVSVGGDGLLLRIRNPGAYAGPRPGSDGLPLLIKRLELAYGPSARLELRGEGAATVAELRLPIAGPLVGRAA